MTKLESAKLRVYRISNWLQSKEASSDEVGASANAEETKYTLMSRHQNGGFSMALQPLWALAAFSAP
jgi:hypothetical protein